MKKKISLIIIGVLVVIFIILLMPHKNASKNTSVPIITLNGSESITIEQNERFIDPGYKAEDKIDGDLTDKVKVEGIVDTDKAGVYEIGYSVTNSEGKTVSSKRIIKVESRRPTTYKDEYDKLENKLESWGTNNKKDGTRPETNMSNEELLKYGAYAMGPDEKTLYLTFDEGSMDTYLEEIVDVLNKNDVKGTFFLCKNYIKNNPELMKAMLSKGHSIGNHTASHPSMPTLATRESFSKYLQEIIDTEKTFKDITDVDLDPIYREPKGEYSKRSLTIIKDLGYKTYFWSAAYKDWDDSLSKEEALTSMIERVHPGAIFLLHPTSQGNYLALDDFIKTMKQEGYKFDLVKNIP